MVKMGQTTGFSLSWSEIPFHSRICWNLRIAESSKGPWCSCHTDLECSHSCVTDIHYNEGLNRQLNKKDLPKVLCISEGERIINPRQQGESIRECITFQSQHADRCDRTLSAWHATLQVSDCQRWYLPRILYGQTDTGSFG